jgi:hypothetical protein
MDLLNIFKFNENQLRKLLGFYISFVFVLHWEEFNFTTENLFSIVMVKMLLFSSIVYIVFYGWAMGCLNTALRIFSKKIKYPLPKKTMDDFEKKYGSNNEIYMFKRRIENPKIKNSSLNVIASDWVDSIRMQIWFETFFIGTLQAMIMDYKIYFLVCAILFLIVAVFYSLNSANLFLFMNDMIIKKVKMDTIES